MRRAIKIRSSYEVAKTCPAKPGQEIRDANALCLQGTANPNLQIADALGAKAQTRFENVGSLKQKHFHVLKSLDDRNKSVFILDFRNKIFFMF